MMIAETTEGARWLAQFNAPDTGAAQILLRNLLLISSNEFENGLFNLVDAVRAEVWKTPQHKQPIALYGIREVSTEESFFDEVDLKKRPLPISEGNEVGSEGRVASLLTSFARDNRKGFLYNPSLHTLASTRCRVLVFIDDIIGSGRRATNFLHAVYRHKRIKSLYSYNRIKFTFVAFGATRQGLDAIKYSNPPDVPVRFAHRVGYGQDWWQLGDRLAVESVCRTYAARTARPKMPLGYSGAFTSIVFSHGCPNTAPPILWAGEKVGSPGRSWKALFTKSPFSDELSACFNPVFDARVSRWQEILRRPVEPAHQDRIAHMQGVAVLEALAARRRDLASISGYTGIEIGTVHSILLDCRRAQFATWDHRLTAAGLRELRYARGSGAISGKSLEVSRALYYPRSLRGV